MKLEKNQQSYILSIIILISFSLIFRYTIAANFGYPLIGKLHESVDILLVEQFSFIFRKNIEFGIVPHLNLTNDWVAFPYGINQSLQSWSIESTWFNYIAFKLTGIPYGWLSIYFFFCIILSVTVVFLLYVNETKKVLKSAIASVIAVFFNFFTYYTYPGHFFYSVVHWSMIGIILDYFLVRRVINRQKISATFLLVRLFALIASLGLDLGYVAGMSLLFFVLAIIYSIAILIFRYKKDFFSNAIIFIKELIKSYKDRQLTNNILLFMIVVVSYLYLPLVIQLFLNIQSLGKFNLGEIRILNNPLKLFQPYLPWFNPTNHWIAIFRGNGNATEFAPGLSLVILTFITLLAFKKNDWLAVVLVFVFFILFFIDKSRPFELHILNAFFWLKYLRVPSRVSMYLSTIISLIFITSNFNWNKYKFVAICIVPFALLEFYTYYFKIFRATDFTKYDKGFYEYMSYIKKQDGQAIFDFPICIVGGNGVGELATKEKTCRLFARNGHVAGFQVFHEKKVFNFYPGRLTEKQFDVYRNLNWHKVDRSITDPHTSVKLTECPNTTSLKFLEKFVQLNDFSGVNLYPDMLPSGCAENFYKIFGKPTVEYKEELVGRMQFIPKKKEWKVLLNPLEGKKMKYDCHCE